MFPFQTRDQILYMGQPPVVATERVTTTKTTTTTTITTAPTLSTRPVVHEVVNIRERDQTKTAERLEELVFEQKKLHEEMLAKQRSEFHKENLKLINRLRNTEPSQPAQQTSNHTNLYIAISLLGGSLIGVLIAVAACYCCRRDTHETRSKDRNSSSSGNALHMTI